MWFVLILFSWASAKSVDERVLAEMISPRSLTELEKTMVAWQRWKLANQACEMEQIKQQVPKSCFEALYWEKKWQPLENGEKVRELNRQCYQASQLDPSEAESPYLSPECAKRVKQMLEIKQYRADDWPDF